MDYSVPGEDLTNIADAIRSKTSKNLCNPDTLTVKVKPNTYYTCSAYVTYDGVADCGYDVLEKTSMLNVPHKYFVSVGAGVTQRDDMSFKTASNAYELVFRPKSGLTVENIQIELGQTMTPYEAFNPLEFPDEFVSEIESIPNTYDANATSSDIRSGKTAYVNGTKLTGTANAILQRNVSKAKYNVTLPLGNFPAAGINIVTLSPSNNEYIDSSNANPTVAPSFPSNLGLTLTVSNSTIYVTTTKAIQITSGTSQQYTISYNAAAVAVID